jgi:hypothetical protein
MTRTDTRLLTLLDLAEAANIGAATGADLEDEFPSTGADLEDNVTGSIAADLTPSLAADLEPLGVSVAQDLMNQPSVAADIERAPQEVSVAADLGPSG